MEHQARKKGGRPPSSAAQVYDPNAFLSFPQFQAPEMKPVTVRRSNINWQLFGCVSTAEELSALARANKVSRRKTDELLTGSKITFRCNSWKRTRCPYQMYSLSLPGGKIYVYRGGEHDHNGVRIPVVTQQQALVSPMNPPTAQAGASSEEIKFAQYMNSFNSGYSAAPDRNFHISDILQDSPADPGPSASRSSPGQTSQEMLEKLLKRQQPSHQEEIIDITTVKDEPSPSTSQQQSSDPGPFPVLEKMSEIIKIATEYRLLVSCNYTGATEILISSADKTKTVVVRDCGQDVIMDIMRGTNLLHHQRLKKTDWDTFYWGLRGLCLHFLGNTLGY